MSTLAYLSVQYLLMFNCLFSHNFGHYFSLIYYLCLSLYKQKLLETMISILNRC